MKARRKDWHHAVTCTAAWGFASIGRTRLSFVNLHEEWSRDAAPSAQTHQCIASFLALLCSSNNCIRKSASQDLSQGQQSPRPKKRRNRKHGKHKKRRHKKRRGRKRQRLTEWSESKYVDTCSPGRCWVLSFLALTIIRSLGSKGATLTRIHANTPHRVKFVARKVPASDLQNLSVSEPRAKSKIENNRVITSSPSKPSKKPSNNQAYPARQKSSGRRTSSNQKALSKDFPACHPDTRFTRRLLTTRHRHDERGGEACRWPGRDCC